MTKQQPAVQKPRELYSGVQLSHYLGFNYQAKPSTTDIFSLRGLMEFRDGKPVEKVPEFVDRTSYVPEPYLKFNRCLVKGVLSAIKFSLLRTDTDCLLRNIGKANFTQLSVSMCILHDHTTRLITTDPSLYSARVWHENQNKNINYAVVDRSFFTEMCLEEADEFMQASEDFYRAVFTQKE